MSARSGKMRTTIFSSGERGGRDDHENEGRVRDGGGHYVEKKRCIENRASKESSRFVKTSRFEFLKILKRPIKKRKSKVKGETEKRASALASRSGNRFALGEEAQFDGTTRVEKEERRSGRKTGAGGKKARRVEFCSGYRE